MVLVIKSCSSKSHIKPRKSFKKLPGQSQVFPVYVQTRTNVSSSAHRRNSIGSHIICHTNKHAQLHTHNEATGGIGMTALC